MINAKDIVGKLARVGAGEYRLGVYGNKQLLESMHNVEAYDRLYNLNGDKESSQKKIGIKIIDLSEDPVDDYGYQCDTIVADFGAVYLEKDSKKEKRLDEILKINAPKYENGELVRESAPIIATYNKKDFSEQKDFFKDFTQRTTEKLKDYTPPHFMAGYEADLDDLSTSILPAVIENDIFDSKAAIDLEGQKNKDLASLVTRLSYLITYTFDAKNPYTKGHSTRVSNIASIAASGMRFDKEDFSKNFSDLDFHKVAEPDLVNNTKKMYRFKSDFIELVGGIANAHDIGKIGIPNSILDKPSGLDDFEYEVMKQHTQIGSLFFDYISESISSLGTVARGIEEHHERYDGKGYPDHKKGTQISTIGRIIAVADAFDAMTTSRSYNRPKNLEQAIIEVCQSSGSQFDPDVVYGFCRSLCKEFSQNIEDTNLNLTSNGLLSSEEGFHYIINTLHYAYNNPPKFTPDGKSNSFETEYIPNYELIKECAEKVFINRETFDKYVENTQELLPIKNSLFAEKRSTNVEDKAKLNKIIAAINECNNVFLSDFFDKDSVSTLIDRILKIKNEENSEVY